MTTDFLALPVAATVQNAIDSLREFEGGVEARQHDLSGRFSRNPGSGRSPGQTCARATVYAHALPGAGAAGPGSGGLEENEVAELFDKYNLQTLPVVDEHNKLTGVITSDDVISMLRAKL
jgi:magnesium transporter